jgi:hypothetical protein
MLENAIKKLCLTQIQLIRSHLMRTAVAVLAVSFALGAIPVHAGGPPNKLNEIFQATLMCSTVVPPDTPGGGDPQVLNDACGLLADTNGWQNTATAGCEVEYPNGPGGGIVEYRFRNCDKNEEALLIKAASGVVKLFECIEKLKEKKGEVDPIPWTAIAVS